MGLNIIGGVELVGYELFNKYTLNFLYLHN